MTKVESTYDGGLVFSNISEIEIERNFLKILKKCEMPKQLAKLPVPTKIKIINSDGKKIRGTWGSQNRLYVNKFRFPFEKGMILKISFLDDDSMMISDISK